MNRRAYAKVNLALKVVGKRMDGFHELEMIMTRISLYDKLIFKKSDKIEVVCPSVKEEDNLVYKVAKYMKEKYHPNGGVKITIDKRIPMEAGLGGGSSDASETILALNDFWGLGLKKEEMKDVASLFGSDTPFFIYNKPCLVYGRGERLEEISIKKHLNLLLIKPIEGFKTSEIFSNVTSFSPKGELAKLRESLEKGEIDSNLFTNDLEKALDINKKTSIEKIKSDLMFYKAKAALMSGAGSCCFGVFDNLCDLKRAYKELKMFYECYIVKTRD